VQQLRGAARAWWASYITTLPDDHHVPWGEFCIVFHAHHLSVGLLHSKLKEFWDLEQGNHSVFDYTRQFNTLAQYGTYTLTRMKRMPTCTVWGSPSICRSAWNISLACRTTSWQVKPSTKRGWWRPLLRPMRKEKKDDAWIRWQW
jgi:hypothetical protein